MFMARLYVLLKFGVKDNQAIAVNKTLNRLGYECVTDMRMGKYIEIDLDCKTYEVANDQVEKMCKEMLVNNVIERYTYDIVEKGKKNDDQKGNSNWLRSCWLRIKGSVEGAFT